MLQSKLISLISASALVLAGGLAGTGSMAAPIKSETASINKNKHTNSVYIVRMADDPVVAYKGGIKGYAATAPKKGQKIDPDNPNVQKYFGYLADKHDKALGKVGGANKLYDYGYAFNGFAAELTAAQADKLQATAGVLSVEKDEARRLNTATTPHFLKLDEPGGLWDQLGGVGSAGEDIIIGIVDGGAWPEHPSFSDRTGSNGNGTKDGKLSYQQIPGWHGKCTPGEAFTAANCNQKLIGARYYNSGWGGNAGIDAQIPHEFNSPRDWGGHGTHTASTAGGNEGVQATGLTEDFGRTNGIAPRARIAAYKVCWDDGGGGSCFNSDSVAAIDQAVADGVDVINFSISGSRTNFRDSVEIAFLYAADAGVFVAASAGNSGPNSSTVAHPGPWLTTVAAGTHDRAIVNGSLTLGDARTFMSPSGTLRGVGPAGLVDAAASGLAGADPATLALCFGAADDETPRLDPAKVEGKIVVCERGGNFLVNKAQSVLDAGGVGMVLVNTPTSANTVPYVDYQIPAVHLMNAYYADVKAYASGTGATATINAASIVTGQPAPFTASFSSRGPLRASGSLLKPDLIAPGQDVLAGVAPPGNGGQLFALYSGTSMSSPHVAGLAALMKELHPHWSPMMIKSALMTTGGDVLDGSNTSSTVIFRQGAGHVRPNSAADPGLVFDSGFNDWLNFICGTQPGSFCSAFTPINPSDLNVASIALGAMPGTQKITRRVTNVGTSSATYTPSVSGLSGITVQIDPAELTLRAGETKTFSVTFTRTTAALNSYTGGQLTWTDGSHSVRVPMVVRPVALAAPAEVSGSYDVTFGYTGSFTATARGLVPAEVTPGSVDQDPDQTFVPDDPTGTVAIPIVIPAGTTYTCFSLFDADVTPGTDIDLFIYQGSSLVGSSTNGGSNEEVNFSFTNPTGDPIVLTVYVHGWGVAGGTTPFALHAWYLGSTAAGNMTVTAPASATQGATGAINLSFGGLASGTKYLGSVAYGGAAGMPNPTIVRVDTP